MLSERAVEFLSVGGSCCTYCSTASGKASPELALSADSLHHQANKAADDNVASIYPDCEERAHMPGMVQVLGMIHSFRRGALAAAYRRSTQNSYDAWLSFPPKNQ